MDDTFRHSRIATHRINTSKNRQVTQPACSKKSNIPFVLHALNFFRSDYSSVLPDLFNFIPDFSCIAIVRKNLQIFKRTEKFTQSLDPSFSPNPTLSKKV